MPDVAALLVLNGIYLLLGIGVSVLLGAVDGWGTLARRIGIAYTVGVATAGIVAAHVALLDVLIGPAVLAPLAAGTLAAALRWGRFRLRPRRSNTLRRPTLDGIVGTTGLLATAAVLVFAGRVFAVRPLIEWDGWAIWALKARALHDFGGADNVVLHSPAYASFHLDYPLLFPALEAMGFRAMGGFDGATIHLQLALLALGFVGALWGLLVARVPRALLGVALFALVVSPAFLPQLASNYADLPLAFFVSLGLAGLVVWLQTPERWLLACSTLFLGAAVLTKNEGTLFVLSALVATLLVVWRTDRPRVRSVLLCTAGVAAILAPWRLYAAANGLPNADYDLMSLVDPAYLADHADRVWPALCALAGQLRPTAWGTAMPMLGLGLAGALAARRLASSALTVLFLAFSYAGLVLIYWISTLEIGEHLRSSVDRTVASPMIAAGALAPLLLAEAWRDGFAALGAVRERRRAPVRQ